MLSSIISVTDSLNSVMTSNIVHKISFAMSATKNETAAYVKACCNTFSAMYARYLPLVIAVGDKKRDLNIALNVVQPP